MAIDGKDYGNGNDGDGCDGDDYHIQLPKQTIGSMLILFELVVIMMRTPRVGMCAADDEQLQIAVGDKPGPVVMLFL